MPMLPVKRVTVAELTPSKPTVKSTGKLLQLLAQLE